MSNSMNKDVFRGFFFFSLFYSGYWKADLLTVAGNVNWDDISRGKFGSVV